jgi:hypothetical protein
MNKYISKEAQASIITWLGMAAVFAFAMFAIIDNGRL